MTIKHTADEASLKSPSRMAMTKSGRTATLPATIAMSSRECRSLARQRAYCQAGPENFTSSI